MSDSHDLQDVLLALLSAFVIIACITMFIVTFSAADNPVGDQNEWREALDGGSRILEMGDDHGNTK